MKTDTKWLRRGALLVLVAGFVAVFTGCFDDDEDEWIPNFWEVTWAPDDTGEAPLTLPYTGENLFDIPNINETAGGYTIDVTVAGYGAGSALTVRLYYTGSNLPNSFDITLVGTIQDEYNASGTYTGTLKDGTFINNGTWSIYEK